MKKQITRSLCCLLALLLCLGSAIYTPAAQDDQTQVSFTVTLATGKATDYATLKVLDKDGKALALTDKGSGTKLDSTMPRPEMLLTDVWLGTRKKKTPAAMIATAPVRTAVSLRTAPVFPFTSLIFVPLKSNLFHRSPHLCRCGQGAYRQSVCIP